MTISLVDLAESIASSALLADVQDPAGLASLHEKLATIAQHSAQDCEMAPQQMDGITAAAASAMRIVEQIILREVQDASASLDQACRSIAEIQQILSGDAPSPSDFPGTPDVLQVAAQNIAPPITSAEHAEASEGEPAPRPDDATLVADFVMEARGHLESAEADLLKLEEHPEDTELVNSIFRAFHTIKGVAGFLNLRQVGALAHAAENLLDRARKGEVELQGAALDVVLESLDATKLLVAAVEHAARENVSIPAHPGLQALLLRLKDAIAGTLPTKEKLSEHAASTPAASLHESALASNASKQSTSANPSAEASVKVSTARLDALINMVGELVIAQAMVSQDVFHVVSTNQRSARNLSHLGKLTRELQDLSMAMRMVPIAGVFQKMSRLVRDLARKAGKDIDIKITGGETELDRNLVEAVADPLVHMVRNAADHGIETVEARLAGGKSRTGRIDLRAYHHSGNIVVQISDDGRGLNKDKILRKARENGLVREGQELSEQEIFRLIFVPGLSTADKITDVSGRGVGMDVVRRNVEALRGRIDIESELGKGSTFSIRLPLTLAVIDGLVIRVGVERYILPITSIEQSLQPRPQQISSIQGRGEVCIVRDSLVPLVRLHKLFKVKPKKLDPCEALLVLVQDGSRRCCLMVDELLGQQQVVIKSLGEATESIPGVSGGAILGDGTISLILDVPGIMDLAAKG